MGLKHEHGGTCAFCGGSVKSGFPTCAACGATWQAVPTALAGLLFLSAIPLALVCAGLMYFFAVYLETPRWGHWSSHDSNAHLWAIATMIGTFFWLAWKSTKMTTHNWVRVH